jgi:perosamine synthetase
MSVPQVALDISQFGRIDKILVKIRELTQNYNENLRELHTAGKISLPAEKQWTKNVYWMCSILVGDGHCDELMEYLARKGIETKTFFYPV